MDSEDNGSQEDQVSKVLKPPCYKIIILGESGVGMHDMWYDRLYQNIMYYML